MQPRRIRWSVVALIGFTLALALAAALLAVKWPFTRNAIIKSLRRDSGSQVTIRDFHQIFFPHPGCVATGVVIHDGPSGPPRVTVDTLTIVGEYTALMRFSRRLNEIRADGMHINVPRRDGAAPRGPESPKLTVSMNRFIAENSVLEFAPKVPGNNPFLVHIHRLVISPAAPAAVTSFDTTLRIPEPPGEVQSTGRFGPWNERDPFQTPVSGTYRFEHADLARFEGLAGTLASTGSFAGTVARLEVKGETDVPDFEIRDASHRLHLQSGFAATVDGQTGDVSLHRVDSRFLRTTLISQGEVSAPHPGDPKTLSLDMAVNDGRIQDLLRLVSSGAPALNGKVNLRFKAFLPSGEQGFLQRLRLTGDIGIGGARFTQPETQQGLERISRNAPDGEADPADVVSELKGHVSVANGVATLSDVTFRVPGASAALAGTYHLLTRRVDLRGSVRLEENLSQTSTGFKSFLLKALDPFFHRKKHLSVVPVRIVGTYGHTAVQLAL